MIKFSLNPYINTWFSWDRVNECFWPGAGGRSEHIDPELAPVRLMSGIYVIGWGDCSSIPTPSADIVQYIGMTQNFKNRIGQFAISSGLHYDERYNGHSAGWRWPIGRRVHMKIAFFPLKDNYALHMKSGILHYYEALAIDTYYQKFGNIVPPLNRRNGIIELDNVLKQSTQGDALHLI